MKTFGTQLAQPYWESSQRLLHPKCVWMESFGGYRHFIFDRCMSEDQLNIQSSPQNETKSTTTTVTSTQMADQNRAITDESAKSLNTNRNDCLTIIRTANLKLNPAQEMRRIDHYLKNDRLLEPSQQWLNDTTSELELSSMLSSNTNRSHMCNEIDLCKDLLADRVLQWLDLAENNNMNNRMICQQRKESIDDKPMAKRRSVTATAKLAKLIEKPSTHRRKLIHHLSMTFDDEKCTANAIQTDDIIPMPNDSIPLRFDRFFPTAYRCSRKFLSLRRTTVPLTPFNLIESLNENIRMLEHNPLERKSTAITNRKQKQFGNFDASKSKRFNGHFDDQYHSMIQRQILENSCNTQLTKRQLHIFMPNLPPKKCTNENGQSIDARSANNDCASCISSQFSSK